jgi:hypothetical protein
MGLFAFANASQLVTEIVGDNSVRPGATGADPQAGQDREGAPVLAFSP